MGSALGEDVHAAMLLKLKPSDKRECPHGACDTALRLQYSSAAESLNHKKENPKFGNKADTHLEKASYRSEFAYLYAAEFLHLHKG